MSTSSTVAWRELREPDAIADALIGLYASRGDNAYSEDVSQTQHALQVGAHAMASRASDGMVVAAFLHDVGHLLGRDPTANGEEIRIDRHHEDVGARFLTAWFDEEVTGAVRLHVPAKRFLCAVDPGYIPSLSSASLRSLALQGGPMSPPEVAEFEQNPRAEEAIELRRWDDRGKEPGAPTPSLRTYRDMIALVAKPVVPG